MATLERIDQLLGERNGGSAPDDDNHGYPDGGFANHRADDEHHPRSADHHLHEYDDEHLHEHDDDHVDSVGSAIV